MNDGKAVGITLEVFNGVATAIDHPSAINFKLHERGIGLLHENGVSSLAIIAAEFNVVIVIGVLEANFSRLLPDLIGHLGHLLEGRRARDGS
jgi:hypothetical protein